MEKPRVVAFYEPEYGGVHNVWVAGDTLYMGAYNAGSARSIFPASCGGPARAGARDGTTCTPATWKDSSEARHWAWSCVTVRRCNDNNNGLWIIAWSREAQCGSVASPFALVRWHAAPVPARPGWGPNVITSSSCVRAVDVITPGLTGGPSLVKVETTKTIGINPREPDGPHGLTVAPDSRYYYVSTAHGEPYGYPWKVDAHERDPGRVELETRRRRR
jgi:hypothetical protein